VEKGAPTTIEFGTPGEMRERLVDLVVAGTKRATASLLSEWEADGDDLSTAGSRWSVLRTDGSCACVVEITDVRVAPFDQVDDTFHLDEGEGDLSRESWIAGHERRRTSCRRFAGSIRPFASRATRSLSSSASAQWPKATTTRARAQGILCAGRKDAAGRRTDPA